MFLKDLKSKKKVTLLITPILLFFLKVLQFFTDYKNSAQRLFKIVSNVIYLFHNKKIENLTPPPHPSRQSV